MSDLRAALHRAADIVADYREALPNARVTPAGTRADVRQGLGGVVPETGDDIGTVIDELVAGVAPGLTGTAGPRFFGFVIGGSTDASVAADVLTAGWDQCAFNEALSPAAVAAEDVAGGWLKSLLGIPETASVGFTTGGQAANTVGLAAARWEVLRRHGWDVGTDGLNRGPAVTVFAGQERHATIDRAVRLLGLGERSIREIPATPSGAMDAQLLARELAAGSSAPVIVCAQSGNVNTGACDDLRAIAEATHTAGGWLHVDGAFGLWAAASPRTRHLVDGIELADSWACDGHKWLNVPYDSGYAFCARPDVHATAMAYTAAYLTGQVAGREFGGGDFAAESSRRARGFATWAAIRALGRSGVAELVDRCCANACHLAASLEGRDGMRIANDVVLNQLLIRVGPKELTDEVERRVQQDGACWIGATTWRGERLLRVSVSNWSTVEADMDACADSIVTALAEAKRAGQ